jgi:hypothetical protein
LSSWRELQYDRAANRLASDLKGNSTLGADACVEVHAIGLRLNSLGNNQAFARTANLADRDRGLLVVTAAPGRGEDNRAEDSCEVPAVLGHSPGD